MVEITSASEETSKIIKTIDEIAFQTNILALNASIQASMAGEAGRGFAVVADEVQRLAERSTNATKQIEVLTSTIQADTKEAVVSMERSTTDVVGGALLAENAGAALDEIEQVSNQLADLIESITVAATKQVQVSEEITVTMQEVGEVSTESSRSSQETATSMDILSRTAHDLRASVEMFKVTDTVKAA